MIFDIFLTSFVFSFFSIVVIILLSGSPQPDVMFRESLIEFAKGGYFATNDLRNYLIGIVIFALYPLLFYFLFSHHRKFLNTIYKHMVFLFLSGVFIFLILMPKQTEIIHLLYSKTRGKQLLANLIYIPLVAILFLCNYFLFKLNLYVKLKPILLRLKMAIKRIVFADFIIFIVIFLFIFNPKYKYSFEKLSNYGGEAIHQFHHVNPYIGPINEIINGKTLLVNATSQYGFLSTYIPTFLFTITHLSYSNFILYAMILAILYTFVFYIFLKKITKSKGWALLGVLIFIKLVFFRSNWPYEAFVLPSTTPVRYFFDIFVILAVFELYSSSYSLWKSFKVDILVSLALLYNLEFGIPILFAYLGTIFLDFFITLTNKKSFKSVFLSLCLFLFSFLSIVVTTIMVIFFQTHRLPDWSLLIAPIVFFSRGFFDIPMPIIDAYYIPLSVYILTYYTIFFKLYKRNYTYIHILFFLLLYAVAGFVYYLGLNEPHHLVTIIPPSIILFIIFANWFAKNYDLFRPARPVHKAFLATFVLFVFGFFFWQPVGFLTNANKRFQYRYGKLQDNYFKWNLSGTDFYLKDEGYKNFSLAAENIKEFTPFQKEALILSRYDTLLLIASKKTSLVDMPNMEYSLMYKKDFINTVRKIQIKRPQFIFVYSKDYSQVSNTIIAQIWTSVKKNYRFLKYAGVIDIYKRVL